MDSPTTPADDELRYPDEVEPIPHLSLVKIFLDMLMDAHRRYRRAIEEGAEPWSHAGAAFYHYLLETHTIETAGRAGAEKAWADALMMFIGLTHGADREQISRELCDFADRRGDWMRTHQLARHFEELAEQLVRWEQVHGQSDAA